MIRLDLPWPHPHLSQNARVNWRDRSKATRKARRDAHLLTLQAMQDCGVPLAKVLMWPRVDVALEFQPPNRIRRDGHNLIGSMKAAIDGISDALRIDDSRFRVSHELSETVVTHGNVLVTLKDGGP